MSVLKVQVEVDTKNNTTRVGSQSGDPPLDMKILVEGIGVLMSNPNNKISMSDVMEYLGKVSVSYSSSMRIKAKLDD